MSEHIRGSCLCGEVSFSITNNFTRFYFCHCKQCQKISGSAHVANLFTAPNAITWLSGEGTKKQYQDKNRDFTVVFCQECGSGLPFVTKNKKVLIVPAGSLDGEPNIMPLNNIFWAERASWYEEGRVSKNCEGFPD